MVLKGGREIQDKVGKVGKGLGEQLKGFHPKDNEKPLKGFYEGLT